MNISENLQRIQGAKTDIKNALNTKQNAGITNQKLDSYANFVKTPSLNYYISDEIKSVGAYGLLQDITSDGITWISGSAEDVFQSATNTDVLCMKSSSSEIRNTGYLLFNLNKRYLIYQIQFRGGLYNSTRYFPYSMSLECYNYTTNTWDQFSNINPSTQGVSFLNKIAYTFWTGLTNVDIDILSNSYSPTLSDLYTNPSELRQYRLGLTGDIYVSAQSGHVISLTRFYFRLIDLVTGRSANIAWN